jgi:hypothetical protein
MTKSQWIDNLQKVQKALLKLGVINNVPSPISHGTKIDLKEIKRIFTHYFNLLSSYHHLDSHPSELKTWIDVFYSTRDAWPDLAVWKQYQKGKYPYVSPGAATGGQIFRLYDKRYMDFLKAHGTPVILDPKWDSKKTYLQLLRGVHAIGDTLHKKAYQDTANYTKADQQTYATMLDMLRRFGVKYNPPKDTPAPVIFSTIAKKVLSNAQQAMVTMAMATVAATGEAPAQALKTAVKDSGGEDKDAEEIAALLKKIKELEDKLKADEKGAGITDGGEGYPEPGTGDKTLPDMTNTGSYTWMADTSMPSWWK